MSGGIGTFPEGRESRSRQLAVRDTRESRSTDVLKVPFGLGEIAVTVRCYSGHTYAGRPQSFNWGGEELAVEEVLAEWREPAGPAFRVRTAQGEFVLQYEERSDRWWLRQGGRQVASDR